MNSADYFAGAAIGIGASALVHEWGSFSMEAAFIVVIGLLLTSILLERGEI